MDSLTLSTIAGSVLSLLFSYVPGLSYWYSQQDGQRKAIVMLVCLIGSASALFYLSCSGVYDIGLACDRLGAFQMIKLFFAALVTNQGTYLLAKKL